MGNVKKRSLFSWLLFDLANTVYAFIIPGLYFSVWLVSEKGWTDQQLGLATSSAMVIVAILGPWIGRKSDSSEGKKKLLLIMTLLCIISTFLLGTFSVEISVLLFVISLIGFNYLISAKSTKCCGIGLKVIPEMWKMTAATSLLSKPERSLQSPAKPDTRN